MDGKPKDLHSIVENEEFFSRIFHQVLTDISDQVGDIRRLAVVRITRQRYRVLVDVVK